MSIKFFVLFVLLYKLTFDALMSIQTNHKAHNYIFNTGCEMLTKLLKAILRHLSKNKKIKTKSILHNEVFLRCLYIFPEGSVYCCDLH